MKGNIYLVGMPGCGKSTVARALAERLDMPSIDCDEVFEQRERIFPSDFIENYGEEAFRQRETKYLHKIAKLDGYVVSTGGGVVTIEENRRLLKETGVAVYIRRPLEELPCNGRILSQKDGVESLYNRRKELYEEVARITVDSCEIGEMIDCIVCGLNGEN